MALNAFLGGKDVFFYFLTLLLTGFDKRLAKLVLGANWLN